jgi:hypothetical protein
VATEGIMDATVLEGTERYVDFLVGFVIGLIIGFLIKSWWKRPPERCPDCQKDVRSLWWHNVKLQHVR